MRAWILLNYVREWHKQNWIRHRRKILIIGSIAILTIAMMVAGTRILVCKLKMPNRDKISSCLRMLSYARKTKAEKYASLLLYTAEKNWNLTLNKWQNENQKWIFKRDYQTVDSLADVTKDFAQQAIDQARATTDSITQRITIQTMWLKNKIRNFKQEYVRLPLIRSQYQKFLASEMMFLESENAWSRGEYHQALIASTNAIMLMGQTEQAMTKMLANYLKNLPTWKQWIDETICWSVASNDIVIIVDKLSQACRVYQNGQLCKSYYAEFGANWIGNKRLRGDKATPEGCYYVSKKRCNGETKYYLALEINYPNSDDVERFSMAKKNGEVPSSAQIGGLIEIHGGGSQGLNWTDGCIALNDEDMKAVFEMAKIGTPITIVGAMEDYFKKKN